MHENSTNHKSCVLLMRERGKILNRVDKQLTQQVEIEISYWRNVLRRVIAVVKSLSSRGLPFRGRNDHFGSSQNGNFIMSLELISEFDPFLANHIKEFGNKKKGSTSYLSFTIYEEFINIMAEKVINHIIKDIKESKYYSISIDSTPDISHVDKLAFIIRYVKNGVPVERFLEFLSNSGHKAEDLENAVLHVLESHTLDLNNCRGQSYDNAANMAGAYSGLQTRIKSKCPLAHFIPCSAHSLNLIGECAVESCKDAVDFFSLLQNLYNFFSISTHRWEKLTNHFKKSKNISLKKLSDTRWSARHEACVSLNKDWNEIILTLTDISEDCSEKPSTRCEAKGLLLKLNSLETALMATLWGDIMERFHLTSKQLQSVDIDLGTVVSLYKSLILYVSSMRNMYDVYEKKARLKSINKEYQDKIQRKKKRKLMNDETSRSDTELDGHQTFKIKTFLVIIDRLNGELRKRITAYEQVCENFDFFFNIINLTPSKVSEASEKLQKYYHDDLASTFSNECVHFRSFLLTLPSDDLPNTALKMYSMIKKNNYQDLYPYVEIALRIFLSCPISNCSAERSFSVLKRVKSYLRSRTTDERLNCLAVLTIESDLTQQLNYDDIIDTFANEKARRKHF